MCPGFYSTCNCSYFPGNSKESFAAECHCTMLERSAATVDAGGEKESA